MTHEGWQECWLPEEYEDVKDVLTPEQIEYEIARLRLKMRNYRIMCELGFEGGEIAIMRARALRLDTGI